MVNIEGAQFWRYEFENNLTPEERAEYPHLVGEVVHIYDFSEEQARISFSKTFNKEAGKLLDRKPW